MLSVERFIRHEDKEYKLVLSLVYDNEKYNWLMLVFSRDISCKISTDENFFEKNLGWQVVLEDFPKECEIMFSKMKDDIFDDLNISFMSDLRDYRINILKYISAINNQNTFCENENRIGKLDFLLHKI